MEEVAPPTCEVAGFHLLHSSLNVYFLYVLYSLDLWHRLLLLKMLRYCGLRSSIDYVVQVGSQPLSKVSGRHLPLRSSVVCAFEHGAIAVPRPLDNKKKKKKRCSLPRASKTVSSATTPSAEDIHKRKA